MRKFCFTLVAAVLAAAVVGGCALTPPAAQPAAADATSSTAAKEKQPEIGVMKPVETPADVLNQLDYEYQQNPDTVGWLRIPATDISNSVVQAINNTYYLRRTERKTNDIYGCYFADYECSFGARDMMSPNTVIYGHSDLKDNPDGLKFSQLFRFTKENFARRTPYIYFSTPESIMTWQIFAAFYTDTKLDYISTQLSGAQVVALAEQAKKNSVFAYDVPVGEADKLLTLSTCSIKNGTDGEQRFVVMAKLLPQDTNEEATAAITAKP